MKVLLVEDDERLGAMTKNLLEYEQIAVDWGQDGQEAIDYISKVNNYLRTASYRKNYRKNHQGKYINLDFAYQLNQDFQSNNAQFQ